MASVHCEKEHTREEEEERGEEAGGGAGEGGGGTVILPALGSTGGLLWLKMKRKRTESKERVE